MFTEFIEKYRYGWTKLKNDSLLSCLVYFVDGSFKQIFLDQPMLKVYIAKLFG